MAVIKMDKNKTLASANSMVWAYFEALRRLCRSVESHRNDAHKKQDAALCVILSVTGVEVFINIYFRILIAEEPYRHAEQCILDGLNRQVGFDHKLKEWPRIVFGKKIDFGSGAGQRFKSLKKLRDRLVHFSSSYETIELPGITINGLADITAYEGLDEHAARNALATAEDFLCELFKLRGVEAKNLCHSLHAWTGKTP